jgi:hypothetical protein
MSKWRRIALRLGVTLAGLLALGLVGGLEGLDYQAYVKAPYFTVTRDRWQAQATNFHLVRGELQAGFGRVRLTPSLKAAGDDPSTGEFRALPLAGYGQRKGLPAQGVHDDVFVKAVAFKVAGQTAVMVGADALIIPREVTELAMPRMTQELGLRREQVYFGATHTHASLGGWGEGFVAEGFAGGFQPGARPWMAQCLVEAARLALADVRPAAVGHGRVAVPQFIRNRLLSEGRVDPEFSLLVVQPAGGKTVVIGSYGAHATVLSGRNMEFSGDYPGAWQRAVEAATGGHAMFLAGGVGSHSPVPGAGGFEGTERMGQALAKTVMGLLPSIPLTNQVTFGAVGVEVALPELHARVTDGLRLRPWLARRLLPVTDRTFLQALRVDTACWISTPCDFSGELALEVKEHARTRGFDAVVTSFNGDYIGYVIPPRYYHLDGYEPRLMSFFGPTVPDYFEDLIRRMIAELGQG